LNAVVAWYANTKFTPDSRVLSRKLWQPGFELAWGTPMWIKWE